MALARDLIGVHDEPEQAIRIGDTGPGVIVAANVSTAAGATLVGGPTGYTLLEINPTNAGVNSVIFMGTTEQDRDFTVYNINTTASVASIASTSVAAIPAFTVNVYPANNGNFQGLGANVPFTIGINKSATVTRLGAIPPFSTSTLTMGTIASDRWIYVLSA